MISFDTNILFYASIEDCPEHERYLGAVKDTLLRPHECVVADQVYFELYRLLRNPAVLQRPLDARTAAGLVSWYRDRSGFGRCVWEPAFYADLATVWSSDSFPSRRTFDAILAVTLKRNGVTRFFTHNLRDFANCGFEPVDPIGDISLS